MNTVENNRLIAEFMGHDWDNISQGCKDEMYEKGHRSPEIINDFEYWTCYNNDWSWLMPVVEKIESLGYVFEIKLTWCKITKRETRNDHTTSVNISPIVLRWEEDETKIEAVYNGVTEFIKWYNKNN